MLLKGDLLYYTKKIQYKHNLVFALFIFIFWLVSTSDKLLHDQHNVRGSYPYFRIFLQTSYITSPMLMLYQCIKLMTFVQFLFTCSHYEVFWTCMKILVVSQLTHLRFLPQCCIFVRDCLFLNFPWQLCTLRGMVHTSNEGFPIGLQSSMHADQGIEAHKRYNVSCDSFICLNILVLCLHRKNGVN